jgi:hypothetical protein
MQEGELQQKNSNVRPYQKLINHMIYDTLDSY